MDRDEALDLVDAMELQPQVAYAQAHLLADGGYCVEGRRWDSALPILLFAPADWHPYQLRAGWKKAPRPHTVTAPATVDLGALLEAFSEAAEAAGAAGGRGQETLERAEAAADRLMEAYYRRGDSISGHYWGTIARQWQDRLPRARGARGRRGSHNGVAGGRC